MLYAAWEAAQGELISSDENVSWETLHKTSLTEFLDSREQRGSMLAWRA